MEGIHMNLGEEEVDYRLLLAVEPAGQDDHEELPELQDEVHGVSDAGRGAKTVASEIPDVCQPAPDGHLLVILKRNRCRHLRFGRLF
jgi:hypothetical protein